MKSDSKYVETSGIVWSLMWAFAIVATAFLFKGSTALYWIECALVVAALAFLMLKSQRPVSHR
jgi:hypothetical protein